MKNRLTPRPDLTNATDEDAAEHMVKWFFENFEDAAERTPYESAEGGYQYIWGGPYDARETLEEWFPNAPDTARTTAIDKIEEDGDDWVPVPHESDYE
jgi:hypothetical protein